MDLNKTLEIIQADATAVVLKLLGAVAIWIVGRWVIRLLVGLMSKALSHNKLDAPLVRYACSILSGALTVFLALGSSTTWAFRPRVLRPWRRARGWR